MASSPPASPGSLPPRPLSAMVRPTPRSNSRMSTSSKPGGGSRASDEDGRTSVKVAVRVRPPLQPTDPGFELIPQRFQRSMVQVTSNTNIAIDSPQGRKLFVFDRVFGPDIMQEGIWEYLSDSVNAFLQGYNVSLLAYGQSGAGKSYTMGTSGPAEQGDLEIMGVIPRAATALFEKLDGGSAPGPKTNRNSMSQLRAPARYSSAGQSKGDKSWSLRATYVEIYNEQLRDLLIPETVPLSERGTVTIREDTKGNIILTGLHQVDINSVDDLMSALNFGSSIRQTDATAINAKSSRSHAVFSLNLVQKKNPMKAQGSEKRFSVPLEAMTGTETWVTTDSKLHFVDLAGSERLKNTGAQGERAREGISINAGLAALGKVISQLSSRQAGSHVSYRDSRLTRLLQDSLGGNAITYMIACVTPAEFHLSETLNTVQYAQRARAIQSKPRIQQVEEGDKQAVIDRLKAEVAFLREQIRSAERGGGETRRMLPTSERSERQNEREVELQNQLLDVQENYTTLSQRHAKLIAEMAKARDNEQAENQELDDALDDTATERLNRSNSFAQAVEQVVLEYEKTIQSLEQSLSSTRTTLSTTETSLLEKESKCAYAETINSQLQTRVQKLMDRETSTENYLHDLENKLDGHTSGEEKNATIILELRKEIARIRENEATCEDYISTLEERLAEADQDSELMQREIDRLEQVIERQRSLGKLDSLLYELDHIQEDTKPGEPEHDTTTNGVSNRRNFNDHSRSQSHVSHVSRHSARDVIPEDEEESDAEKPSQDTSLRNNSGAAIPEEPTDDDQGNLNAKPYSPDYPPQSPAQSRFVADKLENMTQELIDLRVEHESTLNEFETLSSKYEEALRALSEMQDAMDEARHPKPQRDSVWSLASPGTRPQSFLSDGKPTDNKDAGRSSLSRSLSSELSSAMDSPTTLTHDISDVETTKPSSPAPESRVDTDALNEELAHLKTLAAEKEAAERELAERYAQLQEKHQETLDMVEDLKTEVSKVKSLDPGSPRTPTHVIRRKSSQNVMMVDRAHRSFASLRNIASENFEDQPDVMQNFEINLNAAMHELHSRSERIQELESDVASTKKEMETKMQIISGLTRERSSLKPADMSVVSTLRDQLEKNEMQLKDMQASHAARERELQAELETLRTSMKQAEETRALADVQDVSHQADEQSLVNQKKIETLEAELADWENKHQSALESMTSTEKEMKKAIEDLEAQVAAANVKLEASQQTVPEDDEEVKQAKAKHETLVQFLRSEIDEYKAIINSNATKVAELEESHASVKAEIEEVSKARDASSAETETHAKLVKKLEAQIAEHEQAVKSHQDRLAELLASHAKEVEEVKATSKQEHQAQLTDIASNYDEQIKALESELTDAREDLMRIATQVAFALGLDVSVEKLTERIDDLIADQRALGEEQKRQSELEMQIQELSNVNDTVMHELHAVKTTLGGMLKTEEERVTSPHPSVTEQVAAVHKKMDDLEKRDKKSSRLIEELEDQLQNNFDEVQLTNNRLSTLQTERHSQLEEANSARVRIQLELEGIREEYAALQAKYDDLLPNVSLPQRSDSLNSTVRKSASHTSLPSPPPAIPLPPLPGGMTSSSPTSPTPTGVRPPSKDITHSQHQEDQEARIKTIEKQLSAERQLTQTLEEALTDLESQLPASREEAAKWRKRAAELEVEIKELKDRPAPDNRWSLHQVEEERKKRRDAEIARAHLEERMNAINKQKKKKGSLNCF